MEYILTAEELQKLVPIEKLDRATEALEFARVALLKATKFPCIHDKGHRNEYCDDCPCIKDSKGDRIEYKLSKALCTLSRNHSQ